MLFVPLIISTTAFVGSLAALGLNIWLWCTVRSVARVRAWEALRNTLARIVEVSRRFAHAPPGNRFYEFCELLNCLEFACCADKDRTFTGKQRKMLREHLTDMLRMYQDNPECRRMMTDAMMRPTTFEHIRAFQRRAGLGTA